MPRLIFFLSLATAGLIFDSATPMRAARALRADAPQQMAHTWIVDGPTLARMGRGTHPQLPLVMGEFFMITGGHNQVGDALIRGAIGWKIITRIANQQISPARIAEAFRDFCGVCLQHSGHQALEVMFRSIQWCLDPIVNVFTTIHLKWYDKIEGTGVLFKDTTEQIAKRESGGNVGPSTYSNIGVIAKELIAARDEIYKLYAAYQASMRPAEVAGLLLPAMPGGRPTAAGTRT